jgi:tetratricopeptide (TPR) repeat protein
MMSSWMIWYLLNVLTGSPVLSAVLVLAGWYFLGSSTLNVLPRPMRLLRRRLRAGKLDQEIAHRPHDRRARLERAELHLERKQYRQALEVLRPNLEAGDDDPPTLFAMGTACLGAGHTEQGEKLLEEVLRQDHDFRHGEVHLVRGRFRLERGDAAGARAELEKFLTLRAGTIEGRVLLARALESGGDAAGAAAKREEAWHEYQVAPSFRRRAERLWAWRARPSRPLLYAALTLAVTALLFGYVFPRYARSVSPPEQEYVE